MEDSLYSILNLRGGLIIYPSQSCAITKVLEDLQQRLPARRVLLFEVGGQVIATAGNMEGIDTTALGALVVGDLAASQEIAHLTGEYDEYQMVLREGRSHHLFIMQVGTRLALLVQVANHMPLGWARLVIIDGARSLRDVLAVPAVEVAGQDEHNRSEEPSSSALDSAWDSMWSGDSNAG